jgi:hypothetical protein
MTESTHGPTCRRSPEAAASAMCRSRSVDGRDRSGRRDAERMAAGSEADLTATSFDGTPTDSGVVTRVCQLNNSPQQSKWQHRGCRNDEFDVVPRVPQPYYTSLSAVTAPLLVPRPPARPAGALSIRECAGLPPNLLVTRRRTTSPGRIWPAAVDRPSCAANALQRRNGGSGANCSVRSRSSDASYSGRIGPFVQGKCHSTPPLPPSPANCSNKGLRDVVRGTDRPKLKNSLDGSSVYSNGSVTESGIQRNHIESRCHIVHDAVKTEDGEARRTATSSCVPAPVVDVPTLRQHVGRVRSQTMPSDVCLTSNELSQPSVEFGGDGGGASLQQSRSVSFTGLLSRMSPKSIRRLFSGHAGGQSKPSTERCGGGGSVHDRCRSAASARTASNAVDDVTPKRGTKLATLRQWFGGRRRSKDNAVGGSGHVTSPHVEDDVETHTYSSCVSSDIADPDGRYACRQGRLSPKHGTAVSRDAALGLIAQPLYVVEFPDNIDASPTAASARIALATAECSVANERKPPTLPGSRRLVPPTSLEVRSVLGARKSVFRFPTSSVESIGRCSLDASYSTADTGEH